MAATCVVQPIDLVKTRMQLATAAGAGLAKPYVRPIFVLLRAVHTLHKSIIFSDEVSPPYRPI